MDTKQQSPPATSIPAASSESSVTPTGGRTAQFRTMGYGSARDALRPSEAAPVLQRKPTSGGGSASIGMGSTTPAGAKAQAPDQNGLPAGLRSGLESVSGISLDAVKVHYNSSKPAAVGAAAYAEGTDIHLGPGEEKHLAHEAWHVVQQAQGRVRSTTEIGGKPVNDDVGLEHEADVMGAKAATMTPATPNPAQPLTPLVSAASPSTQRVIQGNFPDEHNAERRKSQGLKEEAVQMDHMVSQKTLKTFADTFKVLTNLTSESKTQWQATKEAMERLRAAVKTFPAGDHEFMSEGHLVNIPQNIVPGLADQIQGPGDNYDPQVKKTKTSGNLDRYEETATSTAQREMDVAIRKLNGLINKDSLPTKAADSKNAKKYDRATDQLIASELNIIADAFEKLALTEESNYDADVWYHYGQDAKAVKKRPAEWIRDENQVQIGNTAAPPRAAWQHQFDFQTHCLGAAGGHVSLVPVTVNVTVDVPPATWQHLYDRHYLQTFAGTTEAVDTFWKTDPHTFITSNDGTELLEKELELLLGMSFNFSKPYDNLDDPYEDTQRADWSTAAHKLFFQGIATSDIQDKQANGVAYDVGINLKSIAPQDPDLAYALLPSQL